MTLSIVSIVPLNDALIEGVAAPKVFADVATTEFVVVAANTEFVLYKSHRFVSLLFRAIILGGLTPTN